MIHDFSESLGKGKKGEWIMDRYHDPFYSIKQATKRQDNRGIDRIYKANGKSYLVQIKTDFKSQIHGNVTPETISDMERGIKGWGYTSMCEILIWYLWHKEEVLYFGMPVIKRNLPIWEMKYEKTIARNRGWTTELVKLPLEVARHYTFAIRKPIDSEWMIQNYRWWKETYG